MSEDQLEHIRMWDNEILTETGSDSIGDGMTHQTDVQSLTRRAIVTL